MERIAKIESVIGEWYGSLPHLPATVRQWLADNSWWMAAVMVAIGGLVIFFILMPLLLLGALFAGIAGVIGAAVGGILVLLAIIWMLLAIVSIVLLAIAIRPLRRHEKRGWNLLLVVLLINVAAIILKVMFDFEPASFMFGLLMASLVGYLLFEMRDHFIPFAKRPIEQKT